ncbi:MAG: hypothetical protein KDA89_24025, partial [Planctomycetaceae bacterium]|nr:hypothetical protein [Planctomycetaceae bacterium]
MTRPYLMLLTAAGALTGWLLFDLAKEFRSAAGERRQPLLQHIRSESASVDNQEPPPASARILRPETLERVDEILNSEAIATGEATTELSVEQREAQRRRKAAAASKSIRHNAPLHPQMITPGNFEYLGAFLPPADPAENVDTQFYYGGWAVTWRPDGDPGSSDAFPGSLYLLGHEHRQMVAEISIPQPVVSRDLTALPVAEMLQPFGDITAGFREQMTAGSSEIFKIGGMEVVNGRLHWTVFKYYNVIGRDYPSHGSSGPETNAANIAGPWHLGPIGSGDPQWNSYKNAGYILSVPQPEADAFFEGRNLMSGLQISTGLQYSSQGPALYAYRIPEEPDAAPGDLNALPLLWYSLERPLPRHHPSDRWTGAAWLKAGEKQTIIIIGRK